MFVVGITFTVIITQYMSFYYACLDHIRNTSEVVSVEYSEVMVILKWNVVMEMEERVVLMGVMKMVEDKRGL